MESVLESRRTRASTWNSPSSESDLKRPRYESRTKRKSILCRRANACRATRSCSRNRPGSSCTHNHNGRVPLSLSLSGEIFRTSPICERDRVAHAGGRANSRSRWRSWSAACSRTSSTPSSCSTATTSRPPPRTPPSWPRTTPRPHAPPGSLHASETSTETSTERKRRGTLPPLRVEFDEKTVLRCRARERSDDLESRRRRTRIWRTS